MNNNSVILIERTNIFPCQTCSRAFLRQNELDKHVARLNHVNQDSPEFKHLLFPGCDNDENCVKNEPTDSDIEKRTNIMKNKNDMKRLKCESSGIKFEDEQDILSLPGSSKSNNRQNKTLDHALKSEPKSKKKHTKEKESKEIEQKARSNTDPDDSGNQLKNSENLKEGVEDSDELLTCGQCPKSFKTLSAMTNHLLKHLQSTYQCSKCPSTFPTAPKLNRHVAIKHTDKYKVQCNICHKELINSGNLKIHLRTHTGERPFPCMECGKRFTQAAALYTHTKIHLGIKKHVCSYCSKPFTEYHNMKNHERIHTNERPYGCKHCNKAFSDPSALKRHIRTHTGSKIYECQLCPMKFSDASGLIAHRKRHSGIRDFACKICGKKFFCRYDVLKHAKVMHTDTKDFECDLCKKRFALKQYLRIHIVNSGH